jgi:hypothetical protein
MHNCFLVLLPIGEIEYRDLADNFLPTSSKKGGVTDLNDSLVTATCDKSPSSLRSDSKKSFDIITNPFS